MADFTILTSARRIHPQLRGSEEGFIVKYDGDLFFVFDPDEGYDIYSCEYWTLDIERHFCFEDVDTEFFKYKSLDYKPLDVEGMR